MSRAFIKEGEAADAEELAELRVSPHRNLVTPGGLAQIDATVERLRSELTQARGADDRARIRRVQRDLRYWVARQRTAELVKPGGASDKARFGSVVVLERTDGQRLEYEIVGEDEAEPARGKISYVSPIGRRLIGAQAGDEVELPDGRAGVVEVR